MIRLFKIFAVILYTICATYDAGAATNQRRAAGYNDLYITIKDEKGKPVNDVTIVTQNTKNVMVAHTDTNGLAVFEGKCKEFADLGRNYVAATRNKKTPSVYPVYIKIDAKNYRTIYAYLEWDDMTGKTGCEREYKFKKDQKRTFPKPDKLYYAFSQLKGEPIFLHVCQGDTLNGTKSECIKYFENTNVQYIEGAELAKQYMLQKVIPASEIIERGGYYDIDGNYIEEDGIVCEPRIRNIGTQDYIACTSASGHYAYDFEFDDLIESNDDSVMEDTSRAMCILQGGDFETDSGNVYCKKDSTEDTKQLCELIKPYAQKFSWNIIFLESTFIDSGFLGFNSGWKAACLFDFKEVFSDYQPETVYGLDNYKYENIEIRSIAALEFLLHQYTKAQLGNTFHSFHCASGFRKWNSPYGDRHLFECYLTTSQGESTVEFVFKDVNVRSELRSNAGQGGMTCIGVGGSFDGKKCHGLTHEQCDGLNRGEHPIPGGARWDPDLQQCVLRDATKQAEVDEALATLKTVGEFALTAAGAALVIVATGGTGAPAVIAYVGASLAIGGSIAQEDIKSSIKADVENFKAIYASCLNKKTDDEKHICAYLLLNDYFGYISAYIASNRLKDIFNDQYMKSMEETLNMTLELINPEKLTEKDAVEYYRNNIKPNKEKLVQLQIAESATILGDIVLIFTGVAAANSAKGTAAVGTRITSAMSKTHKFLKPTSKAKNVISKMSDLYSAAVDNCKAAPETFNYCPI